MVNLKHIHRDLKMRKDILELYSMSIIKTPEIFEKANEIMDELQNDYSSIIEVDTNALIKAQNILNSLFSMIKPIIEKRKILEKKWEKEDKWEEFVIPQYARRDSIYDKAVLWNKKRKETKNLEKTLKLIDLIEDLDIALERSSKQSQISRSTFTYPKDPSLFLDMVLNEVHKFYISLNNFQLQIQKQGFFFSREEINPATASKILSKDVQQLDDLYTKYLEIEDHINIDVLDIAKDKIKNAIILTESSQRLAYDKTAILDTFMNWKASFDIAQDLKKLKEIIKDCIDTRNLYYNSADPKKVKASKELQKAITLLMDFSEDLNIIKKGL